MAELPGTQVAPPVENLPVCKVCKGRPFSSAGAKVKAYREHFQSHHGQRAWTQQALADLTRKDPERPGVTKDRRAGCHAPVEAAPNPCSAPLSAGLSRLPEAAQMGERG